MAKGYAYDLLNTEVLLQRLSVAEGGLVLPDGMRYRVLAVDLLDETVPPAALRKIRELAEAGATIVLGQRRPTRAPGLKDHPACDAEISRLAADLWGEPGEQASRRALKKGTVIRGAELDQVLQGLGAPPDFAGPWSYLHRRTAGADIYFVAGGGAGTATFRVQGKEPELWCPQTGRARDAVCYRTSDDGRTIVPLDLPENGSVFVVFRKPAQARHLVSLAGLAGGLEVYRADPVRVNAGLTRLSLATICLRPGHYAVWLGKAWFRGVYMICSELVVNPVYFGLLVALAAFHWRYVVLWTQRDCVSLPSDRAHVLRFHTLCGIALAFSSFKILLVIVTTQPLGRFMDAAGMFWPTVIGAMLVHRVTALRELRDAARDGGRQRT